MTKKLFTILLFVFLTQTGCAQNFDKVKLDQYFDALEKNNKIMGSVAVSKNGTILYQKAIGLADVENNLKATETSRYRIGSISKTFTSVLVMKAVEQQKLSLTQTIDKFFPSIKNAEKITVNHLLRHRSGVHNFTSTADYLAWNKQPKTEAQMVEIIAKSGADFEPDSKAEYSNSNYVLLSYILERTYGKSYADLLQEYIAKPLGLESTYVFGKIDTGKGECKSYRFAGSWALEPETDFTIPLGAGAVTSTPSDLVKFSDALFGGKLLTSESLDVMKSIVDGYGAGLFKVPFYNKTGYGHNGAIDGFSSVYAYFPDDSVSYAFTSNGANFNNNDVSIAVLSAVYNKPYDIPAFTTYSLTSDDLDQYLGVYASNQIPLKITFTKDGNTLVAQGTGQPSFSLDATGKNKFESARVGAKFEFSPAEKKMSLFQGGGKIDFKKESQ